MCEWEKNCSADQVWVNSATWYPITTPESPGLLPDTDSESTMSLGGATPGKEDPSSPCREGRGIRWLSVKPPKLYALPCSWNGWRTADWVAEGCCYSKQWREQPLSDIPGMDWWPSPGCTYTFHGYTPKGCNGANLNSWASIGEYCIQHGTWKQKAHSRTGTNT